MAWYRIKYDHVFDSKTHSEIFDTKEEAMKHMRKMLNRYPYAVLKLESSRVEVSGGWRSIGSYTYRRNQKTKRMRIVKI